MRGTGGVLTKKVVNANPFVINKNLGSAQRIQAEDLTANR